MTNQVIYDDGGSFDGLLLNTAFASRMCTTKRTLRAKSDCPFEVLSASLTSWCFRVGKKE